MHRHAAVQLLTSEVTPKKAFAPDEVCRQASAGAVLLTMGLTLGTASFKHDLVHLSDNSEDRKAEMTASTKQIANRNQAPKCAKMDTRCVELLVSRDRWSLGQR